MIAKGLSTQIGDSVETAAANIVKEAAQSMSSTFLQTSAGIGVFSGDYDVIFAFDQTTDGRLLWEQINAGATNENWAESRTLGTVDRNHLVVQLKHGQNGEVNGLYIYRQQWH